MIIKERLKESKEMCIIKSINFVSSSSDWHELIQNNILLI